MKLCCSETRLNVKGFQEIPSRFLLYVKQRSNRKKKPFLLLTLSSKVHFSVVYENNSVRHCLVRDARMWRWWWWWWWCCTVASCFASRYKPTIAFLDTFQSIYTNRRTGKSPTAALIQLLWQQWWPGCGCTWSSLLAHYSIPERGEGQYFSHCCKTVKKNTHLFKVAVRIGWREGTVFVLRLE